MRGPMALTSRRSASAKISLSAPSMVPFSFLCCKLEHFCSAQCTAPASTVHGQSDRTWRPSAMSAVWSCSLSQSRRTDRPSLPGVSPGHRSVSGSWRGRWFPPCAAAAPPPWSPLPSPRLHHLDPSPQRRKAKVNTAATPNALYAVWSWTKVRLVSFPWSILLVQGLRGKKCNLLDPNIASH